MAIQFNLTAQTERVLKEKAAQNGQTLEAYLETIVARETQSADSGSGKEPADLEEWERGLEELAEGLPVLPTLPADFSRADIYGKRV